MSLLTAVVTLASCSGRFTREDARGQLEKGLPKFRANWQLYRMQTLNQIGFKWDSVDFLGLDPACEVEAELAKKPEFEPLDHVPLCSQSVNIQTVAITSETTREVVFGVVTRYDPAAIKAWQDSFTKLERRLSGLRFVVRKTESESRSRYLYWAYLLIDPQDDQTCEAWVGSHQPIEMYTQQQAEQFARGVSLGQCPFWGYLNGERKQLEKRIAEPLVERIQTAHFQKFDNGWRPTDWPGIWRPSDWPQQPL